MFTYDMKEGYNQILIDPSFRDHLGFKVVLGGKTVYIRYICACFGLKDLPYVYTKVFRPLIKHWRACGFPICQYLDDGKCCLGTYEEAKEASLHIRKDLLRAGAVWCVKKCFWDPVQKVDWLGITWNSREGSIKAKERRERKILESI